MKQRTISLSQRYVTTLRAHLKPGARAGLAAAQALGRQAAAMGVETLDLARMHELALVTLGLSKSQKGLIKRAGFFFNAVNTPVEDAQRAARPDGDHLARLQEKLGERTEELAASNRQVQRGAARRKVLELAADKRGKHYRKNLEESLRLQRRLRLLTQRVIAAHEEDRKKISHELQDEVAQTLLGINVRLLSLKLQAKGNTEKLKDEIASTQRLVAKSARSVRQVAREMGHP